MKKWILLFVVIFANFVFCACGNFSAGVGNFEFRTIHVSIGGETKDFEIEKWYETDVGIEVKTKEAGYAWFSEDTYIMFEDECPFCSEK